MRERIAGGRVEEINQRVVSNEGAEGWHRRSTKARAWVVIKGPNLLKRNDKCPARVDYNY